MLGERIERNLYNLLETLVAGKYMKQRQRLREDTNLLWKSCDCGCGWPKTCND